MIPVEVQRMKIYLIPVEVQGMKINHPYDHENGEKDENNHVNLLKSIQLLISILSLFFLNTIYNILRIIILTIH